MLDWLYFQGKVRWARILALAVIVFVNYLMLPVALARDSGLYQRAFALLSDAFFCYLALRSPTRWELMASMFKEKRK